jgi:hypothetical protein
VLPTVAPGSHGGGGRGVRFRGTRCRRRGLLTSSGAARRPGGSFCAGPRRPGPCAGGCPGCGLAVVLRQAALSRAPAQLLQHTGEGASPGNTGNKLRQSPPERKAPWKARRTRCRRCPCRAGSRGWFRWRSLGAAVPTGDGQQRRTASAAYPVWWRGRPVRVSPRGPAGPPRTPCNLGLCRLLRIHQIRPELSLLHRQLARSLYPGVSLRRRIDATIGPHVKQTPGTLLPPGD